MNLFKTIPVLLFFLIINPASAKLLQIIHTNDLHSHFSGEKNGLGGYARVKTLVDELKSKALAQKIPTLFLDAGDFGEGSSFFFANKGLDAFKAMDYLGVDVTVLGNHDYMLGGTELKRHIEESDLKAQVLSANLEGKSSLGLTNLVEDYADYYFEGLKVRIVGLSTPEIHFQYPLRPNGKIGDPHKVGIKQAQEAKKDGVDFFIALTHTGIKSDTILAEKSRSINIIVGGHDHFLFPEPKMIQNLEGDMIPIVQAGAHGLHVGSIIVDMQGAGEYKLIDYRVYQVNQDITENVDMKKFVDEAYLNRERYFNRSWNEEIGLSNISLSGQVNGNLVESPSCWSKHLARMTRVAGETQLGLQIEIFQGDEVPAGKITFGNIIENFPRFRAWGDRGWSVTTGRVRGYVLKKILEFLKSGDTPIIATIDGLEAFQGEGLMPSVFNVNSHDADLAMVEGNIINNTSFYTLALPSEIPYAIRQLSPFLTDIVFDDQQNSEKYYWEMMEDYIRQNSPLNCLNE